MKLVAGLCASLLLFSANAQAQQRPDCQGYVAWLSILDKELAGLKTRTVDQLAPRAVNLFRDEYFIPLFGRPFEKTTLEERRQYYFGIRNGCGMQSPEARKILRDWDVVVQGAFTRHSGAFSGPDIVAELAKRKALLTRMNELKEARPAPSREGFEAFDRAAAAAKAELTTLWPREETEILTALTGARQKLADSSPESSRIATVVDAQGGVEGSPSGGVPTKNDYAYVDADIANGGTGNQIALPVEQVFQWLADAKFKCLSTTQVVWNGSDGSAAAVQFGTKRFVIDCRGNCRGLRYRINGRTNAQTWHYGLSREVPVLNLRSTDLATHNFSWVFTRPGASGPPPVVRIHSWSNTFGDYGPGCRIDADATPAALSASPEPTDGVAMNKLAADYARSGDYQNAILWLQRAAGLGNAVAMCRLGAMYENGQFFLKDFSQAFSWYLKCASGGNAQGMFLVSQYYFLGRTPVARSAVESFSWAQKSANLGNRSAMVFVAESYRDGRGTERSVDEAKRWTAMSDTVEKNALGAEGEPGKSAMQR
jgi:hypothetical protein